MKSARAARLKRPTKSPTGITGFDEIPVGGLPRGRTAPRKIFKSQYLLAAP